ncbi:DUF169 domain-containing protein [Methanobacterium sp.]|uniref:DUF169 domain-containing protein n=1 Tax=Methanobacterium sp. TaxID=2164 RepID=UPI003D652E18
MGETLKKAGNLSTSPLAVYYTDEKPENAVPMCSADRCVAKSIMINAIDKDESALYIGKDTLKGCCPGAMTYFGYTKPMKFIKYFVSTGNEKFRGGEAEYMKASPEHVEGFLEAVGEIKNPGKYLVIQRCEDINTDVNVKSFLCFGNSESIRNLGSLINFRTKNPFEAVKMPFGPSCATFVTYPAGLAENAPKDTAFVGPLDPTGNAWFPEEYMAIGIPKSVAVRMHEDIDYSFIVKRPQVAYPTKREEIDLL